MKMDSLDFKLSPANKKGRLPSGGPPLGRRAGGWANSARGPSDFGPPPEDKRFNRDSDSDSDMPVIPDLDEVVEEDFTQQVAQAPSVAVNRVATYKELDSDLLRHAAFSTLDDIDLRLLTQGLANEADVREKGLMVALQPGQMGCHLKGERIHRDGTSGGLASSSVLNLLSHSMIPKD
ncbi:intraflagellar transport 43 isoform X1 [Oratosquilla oratoria]|uniref:intraflagellar transport 43 isoform X1 n=1 Tax=Oratosquilla oratoria TaxID=337810 RepID=UPI003F75A752